MHDEEHDLWIAAIKLSDAIATRHSLGAFRNHQERLFTLDPCRAKSEFTCWACPIEECRRRDL